MPSLTLQINYTHEPVQKTRHPYVNFFTKSAARLFKQVCLHAAGKTCMQVNPGFSSTKLLGKKFDTKLSEILLDKMPVVWYNAKTTRSLRLRAVEAVSQD